MGHIPELSDAPGGKRDVENMVAQAQAHQKANPGQALIMNVTIDQPKENSDGSE